MKVLDLIKKRTQYALKPGIQDKWLEEVTTSDDEEVYILLTEQALNYNCKKDFRYISKLREEFALNGLFDLESPLPTTNMRFILYVFSKKPSDTIKIGIYKHILVQSRAWLYDNDPELPDYPGAYLEYCQQIEQWVNKRIMPADTDDYEFNEISRNDLTPNVFNPKRYSKKVFQIEKALKKEDIILLNEVAEVMRPKPDMLQKNSSNYFCTSAWEYPLSYEKLREGVVTDITLQKGDIIFQSQNRFYLMDEEPDRELYPSPNHLVIRPISIQPEYLYLYLKSDTGKTIIDTYTTGLTFSRVKRSDLSNIPVIRPTKEAEEYRHLFYLQNYKVDDVAVFNQINKYFTALKKPAEPEIEDILEMELADKLKIYKQDTLQNFLSEDLKELNACFRAKAYKAAVILAGSILEAVLIDWLSEKHNKNYFKEKCIVTDRRTGKKKQADLMNYIDEIKDIERPKWVEEASKAHLIRQKRNLVHAKLCLKADKVDEAVCRQVIDYLKDVLKTRGVQ